MEKKSCEVSQKQIRLVSISSSREWLRAGAGHCSLRPREARPRQCSRGGSPNIVLSIFLQARGWCVTMLQVNLGHALGDVASSVFVACPP